ncbi:MAG TPA: hypothetical protein VMW52_13025 [Phycisphaerae bacterium]|nr:hypothetical protein [Phycisphaerae bacterium]
MFSQHPVLTLDAWSRALGGRRSAARVRDMARYYTRTERLRRLTRSLFVVVPPGHDARTFTPDPYLVAMALRPDAILSHHAAFDLLGVSRSLSRRFTYFTAQVRRPLRVAGQEYYALKHPTALARAKQPQFGTMTMDRQGIMVRVTGPERTLVDGFAGVRWAGGLDEHVESAAALRDLDADVLERYLNLLGRATLYGAVGWFLERHPETVPVTDTLLNRLAPHAPRQPAYLGGRSRGARLARRWNVLVPPHLDAGHAFEGAPA